MRHHKKREKRRYKPGFVTEAVRTATVLRHLSTPELTLEAPATYPPAADGQSLNAGIHGLATRR